MKPFLRWLLFLCLAVVAGGGGFAAWRYLNGVVTIRVAVSSLDGDDAALLTAANRWLAANKRKFRLRPIGMSDPGQALQGVLRGDVEMASVRGDAPVPFGLASVAVIFKEAAVLVAAPQSGVSDWAGLRGKSIGVIGHTAADDPLLVALLRFAGVSDAKIVAVPTGQIEAEVRRKSVQALAYVGPLAGAPIAEIRAAKPMRALKGAPKVLAIEDAEAIAAQDRRYEEFKIPPGALRPTPPLPEEMVDTLAVARHLVAGRNLTSFFVTGLLSDLMEARRGILADHPLAAQIGAPDTEKNAALPVHAGAAAYFGDEQPSLFDTVTEWIYLAPVLAGGVGTALIWLYHFLWPQKQLRRRNLMGELLRLRAAIAAADSLEDVVALERRLDGLIEVISERLAVGDLGEEQALALFFSADFAERKLRDARAALAPPRGDIPRIVSRT